MNNIISLFIKIIYGMLSIFLILYYFYHTLWIHIMLSILSGFFSGLLYFLLLSYKYTEISFFKQQSILSWIPLVMITVGVYYFNLIDTFLYLLLGNIFIFIFVWYWKHKK